MAQRSGSTLEAHQEAAALSFTCATSGYGDPGVGINGELVFQGKAHICPLDVIRGCMSKEAAPTASTGAERELTIDDRFQAPLTVADMASVAWLGRDYDVSFFAVTPIVRRMWGPEGVAVGASKIDADIAHREVARVRMGPSSIVHTALNLAMTLYESDRASFDNLMSTIALRVSELSARDIAPEKEDMH